MPGESLYLTCQKYTGKTTLCFQTGKSDTADTKREEIIFVAHLEKPRTDTNLLDY